MIISCIGDSITEGDYGVPGKSGIANVKSANYPYFLSNLISAEVRNFGKCGYKASTFLNYYKSGNVDVRGSDFIIIMLGTNGGIDPLDFTSFENVCYRKIVELCRFDAPAAKIFLCTPPHVTENPIYSNCGYRERVNNAVKFVREFAKRENMPLIDLAAREEFCEANEALMQPNDGLHFGRIGYMTMAKIISDAIIKN